MNWARIWARVSTGSVALLLAGCSAFKPIEPQRKIIQGAYSVAPRTMWATAMGISNPDVWTVEGLALHTLRFYRVRDGDRFEGPKDIVPFGESVPEDRRRRFQRNITEVEIAELVLDSVFIRPPRPENLRPASFGGAAGFRFDFAYVAPDGVDCRGLVVGVVLKDTLHVILYEGVAIEFFGRYREQVEQLIASVQLQ